MIAELDKLLCTGVYIITLYVYIYVCSYMYNSVKIIGKSQIRIIRLIMSSSEALLGAARLSYEMFWFVTKILYL